MRSRAGFLAGVLVVVGLLGGVTAGSVTAATSTTVTWKVSSLTAGQVKNLSDVATSNSPGVKTWSKSGSCTLSPTSNPTTLTMGSTGSCTLTLQIAKTNKYSAKTSTQTILVLTCATGGACALGQKGPGGGTVFYVDKTRPAGSRYFEAACAGWSDGKCGGNNLADPRAEWGCYGTYLWGANGTAIGTGEQNTTDIAIGCEQKRIAAKIARDLVLGGQKDWFLPSKNELERMYNQKRIIGHFSSVYYWSSSENGDAAWAEYFNYGLQGDFYKDYAFYIRPIRSF